MNCYEAEMFEVIIKQPTKVTRRRITSIPVPSLPQSKETFSCEQCSVVVSSRISLKRHIARVHHKERNYHCDVCSYSAFFKHSLEKHIVKHIPEEFRERFPCDLCAFVSISSVNFQLHKKYEHGEVKKSFVCDFSECNKRFARPGQLKAHIRLTHEKRKDKICSSCGKAFSTTTRLKEHLISAHSSHEDSSVSCEFCSKRFMTLRTLKNHLVYHEKPQFHCQLGCEKSFFRAALLDGHHKSHLAQKDFVCPFMNCNQKYFLKSHLNRHIRSYHDKLK